MSTFSVSLALRAVHQILADSPLLEGVVVIPHNAPPPMGDAQDANDCPPERWCRIANLAPSALPSRSSGVDGDHVAYALSVTVGCSHRLQALEPTRVERDADAVSAALRGSQIDTEGQALTVHRAMAQPAPDDGSHPGHRIFIVTATGRATRP